MCWILLLLLFSLYTNSCTSSHPSVKLLKFADDTTLIGLISGGDESDYRWEAANLVTWCSQNNLELNALKTVEMVVDFRKNTAPLTPHHPVRLPSQHCGVLPLPGHCRLPGPQVGTEHQLTKKAQQMI